MLVRRIDCPVPHSAGPAGLRRAGGRGRAAGAAGGAGRSSSRAAGRAADAAGGANFEATWVDVAALLGHVGAILGPFKFGMSWGALGHATTSMIDSIYIRRSWCAWKCA